MKCETRQYINELTQQIRKTYELSTPITDIAQMIPQMGGTLVELITFDELHDGIICKHNTNNFILQTSLNATEQEKKFTIAKALGHLFLHMGFKTNASLWERQTEGLLRNFRHQMQEEQAHEFAMALLMPQNEYADILQQNATEGKVNTEVIAKHFCVPIYTAIRRGKELGLLA